jgi:hypothetical protein
MIYNKITIYKKIDHICRFTRNADNFQIIFAAMGFASHPNEGGPQAAQISDTGNAVHFSFSPDGRTVAFQTAGLLELWAIDKQGENLRRLVSEDQVKTQAGEPTQTDEPYTYGLSGDIAWDDESRRVGFAVQRGYEGLGGCCEYTGHFQVDVHTGEVRSLAPPADPISPDYRWVAKPGSSYA